MKTIKVIDVLNKLARGEEVPTFIIGADNSTKFYVKENSLFSKEGDKEKGVEWYLYKSWLNEEVEIIEEDKKIEKLTETCVFYGGSVNEEKLILIAGTHQNKINELIDIVNEMKSNV